MKAIALSVLLLLVAGRVVAQVPAVAAPTPAPVEIGIPEIAALIDTTTGEIKHGPDDNKFVTNKTFNHFAAKRQAYYLSGVVNLSLFKNFAIANVTEGVLQLGNNFAYKGDDELIKGVFTVALQSNIANNISNLLAKDKLANDLGIPLSYTFFLRTKILKTKAYLFDEDVEDLNGKRAFQYALLKKKMAVELGEISTVDMSKIKPAAQGDTQKKLAKSAVIKKTATAFYDAELSAFENDTPNFRTAWVRLQGFVPISNSKYQVAPAEAVSFQEESVRKWSAGVSLGGIYEANWFWGTVFANISARITRTNAVEQKADGIKGYTQYDLLNLQTPTKLYYSGDGTKVYIGNLDNKWTVPVQYQVVYFPPFKGNTKVGLDIQVERYSFNYAKTNMMLGIPIFLQGQDDKGINVEAQLKWRDVDKNDVAGSDRFTVGLSVALPFGSIVK